MSLESINKSTPIIYIGGAESDFSTEPFAVAVEELKKHNSTIHNGNLCAVLDFPASTKKSGEFRGVEAYMALKGALTPMKEVYIVTSERGKQQYLREFAIENATICPVPSTSIASVLCGGGRDPRLTEALFLGGNEADLPGMLEFLEKGASVRVMDIRPNVGDPPSELVKVCELMKQWTFVARNGDEEGQRKCIELLHELGQDANLYGTYASTMKDLLVIPYLVDDEKDLTEFSDQEDYFATLVYNRSSGYWDENDYYMRDVADRRRELYNTGKRILVKEYMQYREQDIPHDATDDTIEDIFQEIQSVSHALARNAEDALPAENASTRLSEFAKDHRNLLFFAFGPVCVDEVVTVLNLINPEVRARTRTVTMLVQGGEVMDTAIPSSLLGALPANMAMAVSSWRAAVEISRMFYAETHTPFHRASFNFVMQSQPTNAVKSKAGYAGPGGQDYRSRFNEGFDFSTNFPAMWSFARRESTRETTPVEMITQLICKFNIMYDAHGGGTGKIHDPFEVAAPILKSLLAAASGHDRRPLDEEEQEMLEEEEEMSEEVEEKKKKKGPFPGRHFRGLTVMQDPEYVRSDPQVERSSGMDYPPLATHVYAEVHSSVGGYACKFGELNFDNPVELTPWAILGDRFWSEVCRLRTIAQKYHCQEAIINCETPLKDESIDSLQGKVDAYKATLNALLQPDLHVLDACDESMSESIRSFLEMDLHTEITEEECLQKIRHNAAAMNAVVQYMLLKGADPEKSLPELWAECCKFTRGEQEFRVLQGITVDDVEAAVLSAYGLFDGCIMSIESGDSDNSHALAMGHNICDVCNIPRIVVNHSVEISAGIESKLMPSMTTIPHDLGETLSKGPLAACRAVDKSVWDELTRRSIELRDLTQKEYRSMCIGENECAVRQQRQEELNEWLKTGPLQNITKYVNELSHVIPIGEVTRYLEAEDPSLMFTKNQFCGVRRASMYGLLRGYANDGVLRHSMTAGYYNVNLALTEASNEIAKAAIRDSDFALTDDGGQYYDCFGNITQEETEKALNHRLHPTNKEFSAALPNIGAYFDTQNSRFPKYILWSAMKGLSSYVDPIATRWNAAFERLTLCMLRPVLGPYNVITGSCYGARFADGNTVTAEAHWKNYANFYIDKKFGLLKMYGTVPESSHKEDICPAGTTDVHLGPLEKEWYEDMCVRNNADNDFTQKSNRVVRLLKTLTRGLQRYYDELSIGRDVMLAHNAAHSQTRGREEHYVDEYSILDSEGEEDDDDDDRGS